MAIRGCRGRHPLVLGHEAARGVLALPVRVGGGRAGLEFGAGTNC